MIVKETLEKRPLPSAISGSAAVGERGLSFQELTRKRRVAARRDKKKGQPSTTFSNGNKTKSEDVADGYQETQDVHKVRFPRSVSQDRLFVVAGNVTDKTDERGSQSANINHKTHKKLRWKEQWSAGGEGETRDCDEAFPATQSACHKSATRGFHADASKKSDFNIATCDHQSDNTSRFEPLEGQNSKSEEMSNVT